MEDLFSDHIDLFLPCPNSRAEEQSDEAIYVPNPKYRESGDALSMWRILFRLTRRYTFVGNLIGGCVLRNAGTDADEAAAH